MQGVGAVISEAAYSAQGWHDFFVVMSGAAAVLSGLVFVALSINLDKILLTRGCPAGQGRQSPLCSSARGRGAVPYPGIEAGDRAGSAGGRHRGLVVCHHASDARRRRRPDTHNGREPQQRGRGQFAVRVVVTQAATLPVIVAGAALRARAGGGFYWLVPGLVLLLLLGVVNAWVLLVEIVR
jgi:hypothetical protein